MKDSMLDGKSWEWQQGVIQERMYVKLVYEPEKTWLIMGWEK